MSSRKEWFNLIVGFSGALLGTFGVLMINSNVLTTLPGLPRIILYLADYWLVALVPLVLMYLNKEKMRDYLTGEGKIALQVLAGIGIGLAMSFILTLIPHLAGFGDYVDNGSRHDKVIEFVIEFIYFVFSVSFVEEFVFRGFIFKRLKNITGNDVISLIVSSVLFGLLHIFQGNIIQILITAFIGAFLCFCRLKIKTCSLLSLIIAHGIYDFLISFLASINLPNSP